MTIPPLAGCVGQEVSLSAGTADKLSSECRRHPRQFRKHAAALVIDQHRTVAKVARELGVC